MLENSSTEKVTTWCLHFSSNIPKQKLSSTGESHICLLKT